MSDVIISVEHLSKRYRLGEIGAHTLHEAAERLWHKLRGRDPDEHMGIVGERRRLTTESTETRRKQDDRKPDMTGNAENLTESLPSNSQHVSPPLRASVNSVVQSSSDDLWALKDVSFEVKRGEVLGIIGRNGAGKSTLLKILSRITEPTSGRAIMRGRVESLFEVGTGFHPELTGRENVFLNGAFLGMKKKEITAKFDEIVAFSEVERFIDTPVKRHSSGSVDRRHSWLPEPWVWRRMVGIKTANQMHYL
jgi:ABC-type glutathione transport system ATPase component